MSPENIEQHMQVDEARVLTFLQGIEQGSPPNDYWLLPEDFISRARVFNADFEIHPFGREQSLPFRRCHHTTIHIVEMDDTKRAEYATGFVLYRLPSSNHWARHSWVVNQVDSIILEPTPNEFDIYVGLILNQSELEYVNTQIWS